MTRRTVESVESDPYVVLGVPRTATDGQIRDAYRALGSRYHPDRHHGNPLEGLAAAKMAEINQAYETLSDPERRVVYDRDGAGAFDADRVAAPRRSGRRARLRARRMAGLTLLLLALPLLLRFGGVLLRAVAAGTTALVEALASLRGTPVGLVLVIAAALALGVGVVRHRRR